MLGQLHWVTSHCIKRSAGTGDSDNSLWLCDTINYRIFKKICPCSRSSSKQQVTGNFIYDLQLHGPMSCCRDLWPFVSQPFIYWAAIFCRPLIIQTTAGGASNLSFTLKQLFRSNIKTLLLIPVLDSFY